MSDTFDLESRWPELFTNLSTEQRDIVLDTLYSQYLEGWRPDRATVADLADYVIGTITAEEHTDRVMQRLAHRKAGQAGTVS